MDPHAQARAIRQEIADGKRPLPDHRLQPTVAEQALRAADVADHWAAQSATLAEAEAQTPAGIARAERVARVNAIRNAPRDTAIFSPKAFAVTLEDGAAFHIAAGRSMVPVALLEHWYLKAHGVTVMEQ